MFSKNPDFGKFITNPIHEVVVSQPDNFEFPVDDTFRGSYCPSSKSFNLIHKKTGLIFHNAPASEYKTETGHVVPRLSPDEHGGTSFFNAANKWADSAYPVMHDIEYKKVN